MEKFDTILELLDHFKDEKVCIAYLESLIWEDTPRCAHCGSTKKIYRFESRGLFKCSQCSKQFTVTTGTIFHGTRVPLRKWFVAIYLFTIHKKGVSARQLARDLKVTVKTAWFMEQRIRAAIQNETFGAKMEGTVTVDESMWGQRAKNIHRKIRPKYNQGRKGDKKLKIFSLVEQDGRVKSIHVPNFEACTLQGLIYQYVEYTEYSPISLPYPVPTTISLFTARRYR